jgi:hypothetical protein
MQLIVDAWWAVVVALHLVTLWRYGAAVAATVCVAAYLIYFFGALTLALRAFRLSAAPSDPRCCCCGCSAFSEATERLFDMRLPARWRFEGPVAMIAGGDPRAAFESMRAATLAFVRRRHRVEL